MHPGPESQTPLFCVAQVSAKWSHANSADATFIVARIKAKQRKLEAEEESVLLREVISMNRLIMDRSGEEFVSIEYYV